VKLLTRTNIFFVGLTLIVFTLGGTVFYKTFRNITREDATERLQDEKTKILTYVSSHQSLPQNTISLGDTVAFYQVVAPATEKTGRTKFLNPSENEYEPYQTLEFNVSLKGVNYRAVIFKPLIEADDLQHAIFQAIAIVSLILVIVMVLANFAISRFVWKPFHRTLEKIKEFDLAKEGSVSFSKTSIKEFSEMNAVLETMTNKIAADYKNLKQFTENASHELQTPLSIIQSKLELMIQAENLSADQMEEVRVVYEATGRLSKLNQALLLLAKIENRQFVETKQVALNEIVESKLNAFEELIKHKNLSVERNIEPVTLQLHQTLADILLSNLIGNSIKHNIEGGRISIKLNKESLVISNSGGQISMLPHELFHRFRKASDASDSLGLGLAIVKEICDAYGFDIQYMYANMVHTITISF
jgi:signal transduction histidine kinase